MAAQSADTEVSIPRRRLALPRGSRRAAQQDHRDRAAATSSFLLCSSYRGCSLLRMCVVIGRLRERLVLSFSSFFHQVYLDDCCVSLIPRPLILVLLYSLSSPPGPAARHHPPSWLLRYPGRRLRFPVLSLSPRDGSIGGGERSSTAGASSPVISPARHRWNLTRLCCAAASRHWCAV